MHTLKQVSIDKILPNKDYIVLEQEFVRGPLEEGVELRVMTKDEIEDDLKDYYIVDEGEEELSWEELCNLSIEDPERNYLIYTGEE